MPKLRLITNTLTDSSGEEYSEEIITGETVLGSGVEVTDGDIVATTGDVVATSGNLIAEEGDVEAVNATISNSITANSLTAATGTFTTEVTAALGTFTSVSAPFKTFNIEHPSKENKRLVYACLEGPEIGVYFRGKTNQDVIVFPDYWTDLVDEDSITVHLTPTSLNQDKLICTNVGNNQAMVHGANNENYFFIVYGERKDIPKLGVEIDA